MLTTRYAVIAEDLVKHYRGGNPEAGLNGLNLRIPTGTVWGLLGPNGAGKTTAIRVLCTLLRAQGGRAQVAGHDLSTEGLQVRRSIGLVGQFAALDEKLNGRDNLVLFARLNGLGRRGARERAEALLAQFGLGDSATLQVSKYSGGMRRRLDLAAGLIVSPPVLFVDEPTTGLDPAGRREVWNALRALKSLGTSIVLTTQYLEEADQLADGISILKEGRIIAEGSPKELKAQFGQDWLEVRVSGESSSLDAQEPRITESRPEGTENHQERITEILARVSGAQVQTDGPSLRVPVAEGTRALLAAAEELLKAGIEVDDIGLRRPSLDDVFLLLTQNKEENCD